MKNAGYGNIGWFVSCRSNEGAFTQNILGAQPRNYITFVSEVAVASDNEDESPCAFGSVSNSHAYSADELHIHDLGRFKPFGNVTLFGVKDHYAFQYLPSFQCDVDSLIPHSRLRKADEPIYPELG